MTAAYHAAATQLLIGQANFVAGQIGISETFPSDTNLLAELSILPPSNPHISQVLDGAPVCDRLYGLPSLKAGHRPALHTVANSSGV
jgi:hypothetical protein